MRFSVRNTIFPIIARKISKLFVFPQPCQHVQRIIVLEQITFIMFIEPIDKVMVYHVYVIFPGAVAKVMTMDNWYGITGIADTNYE